MRRDLPIIVSLAALAACQTTPTPAPSVGPYRAGGTEPFWSISIMDDHWRLIRLGGPDVEGRFEGGEPFAAPATLVGRSTTGDPVRLLLTARPCSDGMSDRVFEQSVTLTLGREILTGCGGTFTGPRHP